MRSILKKLLRFIAFRYGRATKLYLCFCQPNGEEWADFLKKRNFLFGMGEDCAIQTNVVFTDPKYVRLGNNVRLSGCTLFGHDGSVNMINRAFGWKIDRVGKIDIRDNVFIGHGAIILPNVTIGANVIIAAGAVVNRDVPENSVVAGVPAKEVAKFDELAQKMKEQSAKLPWIKLIEKREGSFDSQLQPILDNLRCKYFWEVNG
ncbi:MAG: acyltransferase [Pyrinomonadaceae bacterium]|nr:acyltransferase [Pyrinomonadaceae bacterium]